jgi:hypothetical protein
MAKRKSTRIITILQIGKTTVDRDLVYLRKQAQENLKLHIQERLPEQYQKCMIGLNQVLKMGWDIVHNDSSTAANRLQALALINDSYKYVMDLTTNGVIVTDAIKFVQTNKEKLTMSTKEEHYGEESKLKNLITTKIMINLKKSKKWKQEKKKQQTRFFKPH